ncbi:MAG: 1-acyl-sn-glycerol-3-phosphate acyltransferase [Terriglobia bacterium]
MVAEVAGGEETDVNGSSQLAKDLKLDSLGKMALLNRLEEEYQIEIAEDQFSSVNTLGELRDLLSAQSLPKDDQKNIPPTGTGPPSHPSSMRTRDMSATHEESFPYPFPAWPMRFTVTALRRLFSVLFLHPLTWLLARPSLKGQALLKDLSPPVLLVSNHVTFLDPALVLYALPRHLRRSVAVAMDGERLRNWRHAMGDSLLTRFFSPLAYLAVVTLFNVFPLPRKGSFRQSFEYAGEAMDRGYSVLVFPEGLRTLNGQPAPFQQGIGVLAAGLNATVVPLRLEGLFEIKQLVMNGKRRIPYSRAGEITVRFGKPIHASDLSKDPSETTRFLESTIRNLPS